MILEVLSRPEVRRSFLEAMEGYSLRAQNASIGEERLLWSGISWERYEEIDEALGHDRPDPRLFYLGSELEMMSTSLKHEELKKWLADLLGDHFYERRLATFPHGQATMRILREAGAEPDESWCFGEQKEWPDLVLEISLTSGGVDKLQLYQRFRVPEVWILRRSTLEIWILRRDGSGYDGPTRQSRLLPDLDSALLTHCLTLPSWHEARKTFRDAHSDGAS